MAKLPVAAFGLALFILLGSIAIPAAIDNSNDNNVESIDLDVTESEQIGINLQVGLPDSTNTEATVRVTAINTGESFEEEIPEGNTTTFEFDRGNVSVTAETTTTENAVLLVEYPSTFGYSDGILTIRDNLPLILVTMLFIGIMAFVGVRK